MSQDTYDIFFKGEVMPGLDPAQVKGAMAALFKAAPEKIEALFRAEQSTIKKGLDRASAEKYREVLKKAGAIVYLRRAGASKPAPAVSPSESSATPKPGAVGPAASQEAGISIAAMSGNLVRDDERTPQPIVDVATDHIQLANQFDTPELETPTPPAAPDTSHISIADAGADINPDKAEPIPVAEPDTSSLSLAPADVERITDPSPEQEFDLPDISELDVEEPGELLKPDEKKPESPPPEFKTSLTLEEPKP